MGTRVKPEYDDGGCCGDGGHYDGPGTGPSQTLTLSLSKGEGFNTVPAAILRQSQYEVRDKPNHKSRVVIASGEAARQSRAART